MNKKSTIIDTTPEIDELKIEYERRAPLLELLRSTACAQLSEILTKKGIVLGVPLESRVKSWDSFQEKLERKTITIKSLDEINDLVGVRAILLFRDELSIANQSVHDNFDVIESEDTAARLTDAQFGYQSQHYTVQLPKEWLLVPTMQELSGLKVEIQIRTLAQHVWAAASHKLQYKHEDSVPRPILRTINRIAALLETVDLEFDRVLEERTLYQTQSVKHEDDNAVLNVDSLSILLDKILPPQNKSGSERYEELLTDLKNMGVSTAKELRGIWESHKDNILRKDAWTVKSRTARENYEGTSKQRILRGVFYTHAGLIRKALLLQFGNVEVDKAKAKR